MISLSLAGLKLVVLPLSSLDPTVSLQALELEVPFSLKPWVLSSLCGQS